MTKTEKYIKDAIKEAAKDFKQSNLSVADSSFIMNPVVNIGEAAEKLARAMIVQAEANKSNSEVMQVLAGKLDMVKITAIEFE